MPGHGGDAHAGGPLTSSHSAKKKALSASALLFRKLLMIWGIWATSQHRMDAIPRAKPAMSHELRTNRTHHLMAGSHMHCCRSFAHVQQLPGTILGYT